MTETQDGIDQQKQADERTGIPHPDGTVRWLVPPWPANVMVHDLVQHFHRFRPATHASSAIQAAYYSRYADELAATSGGNLAGELSYQWYVELLRAVNRAAVSAAAEHEALDAAQKSLQFSLVRTFGLNSLPIAGQAL